MRGVEMQSPRERQRSLEAFVIDVHFGTVCHNPTNALESSGLSSQKSFSAPKRKPTLFPIKYESENVYFSQAHPCNAAGA